MTLTYQGGEAAHQGVTVAPDQHLDHGRAEGFPDEGAEVVTAGHLLIEGPDGRVQTAEQQFSLRPGLLTQPGRGGGGGEECLL